MNYENLVGFLDRAFLIGNSTDSETNKQKRIDKLREELFSYLGS